MAPAKRLPGFGGLTTARALALDCGCGFGRSIDYTQGGVPVVATTPLLPLLSTKHSLFVPSSHFPTDQVSLSESSSGWSPDSFLSLCLLSSALGYPHSLLPSFLWCSTPSTTYKKEILLLPHLIHLLSFFPFQEFSPSNKSSPTSIIGHGSLLEEERL